MKRKILLLILTLGFLGCVSAQTQETHDKGHRLDKLGNTQVRSLQLNSSTEKSMAPVAITKRSNKACEDQATYQVNFTLDFDAGYATEILLVNHDNIIKNTEQGLYQLVKGSNVMPVPAGTYDILVMFIVPPLRLWVIREQVDIDKDMTLNFAANEAKNHIDFQQLTINDEQVNTGTAIIDQQGNISRLGNGNVDGVFYQSRLLNKDYGTLYYMSGNIGPRIEGGVVEHDGGEAFADFYVNDVSNRYVFYCLRAAYVVNKHEIYASAYEAQGASDDISITNDPSKFVLFEDPFLLPEHEGEDVYQSFTLYPAAKFQDYMAYRTDFVIEPKLSVGDICKYYVSASTEDSQNYISFIRPEISTKTIEVIEFGDGQVHEQVMYNPVLLSKSLIKTNDQLVFANNGVGSDVGFEGPGFLQDYSQELDEEGQDIQIYPDWPTHPVFSYSVDKKKGNFGNNVPILVSSAMQYESTYEWVDENGNPKSQNFQYMDFSIDYMGRFGEKKPDDANEANVNFWVNGETIWSNQGGFYRDELINGTVDATITNEGIMVDDMVGLNKTEIHYTAGSEDENSPTMTMLHFKEANGNVTDRFTTASDGTLEFSAGDFNFMLTPMGFFAHERIVPKIVEVNYSPYGEDNWNELPVEEVPENYWPTMGWFYTTPLASVTGEAYKGWFDLKIKLTDAAGNWQEQIISPAFRINNLAYSSVANVGKDNAHEVARYNLAGQRVDSNHRGVTIIKMSDGTAKKIVQ